MPDFKTELERLLNNAAECQLLGSLSADPAKRAEYRRRAAEFGALAEEVRLQLVSRRPTDVEFLQEHARHCRTLAEGTLDETIRANLLSLAADLERTARRERGDH